MVYRVPCPPPGGPPLPKPRRFKPQRTPEPLLSTLLAMQAFSLVALLMTFVVTVMLRFTTTQLSGCGCSPTLTCLVR
jgi:hypothetical protein